MSPTTAEDILKEDNYFFWEFNTRMKLAKKSLMDHVDAAKAPSDADPRAAEWKVNDLKAFAIVVTLVSPNLQSMVRNASSTAEAWEILKNFFIRRSIHNRVQMRRQLHEFKMVKGSSLMNHLMKFDELCESMSAIGDYVDPEEQLVILLGSVSEEYDPTVKIIENMQGMDIFRAKEMLRREYDGIQRKEAGEVALKASNNYKKNKITRKISRNKNSTENAMDAENLATKRKTAGTMEKTRRKPNTHLWQTAKVVTNGYWIVAPVATCVLNGMISQLSSP